MALGDFPIDYDVKPPRRTLVVNGRTVSVPTKTTAPDGHHRRCQGRSVVHRGQCRKYALRGTYYCAAHTRRIKVFSVASKNIYALRVNKRLKALLDEIEKNPDERMELASEIDTARAFTAEAVSTASAVMDSEKMSIESKMTAIKLAHESISEVATLVEKYSKICALTDGLLTPSQVSAVVKQVSEIVTANIADETLRQKILDQLADVIVPKTASNIQVNIL